MMLGRLRWRFEILPRINLIFIPSLHEQVMKIKGFDEDELDIAFDFLMYRGWMKILILYFHTSVVG